MQDIDRQVQSDQNYRGGCQKKSLDASLAEEQLSSVELLLAQLLHDLRISLEQFFSSIEVLPIANLAKKIAASSANVFLAGIGKSGLISRKIATTISSTGTRAFFLSPVDALHGDLGALDRNDIVIMLSKSGETEELLALCPALRNKGAHLVAVVSHSSSRLARASDTVIHLPLSKELCPFDLSPTTSTIEQLIFGDLLAMALMRMKNISLQEYISNHPAGKIGRRQLLKVRDLMIKNEGLPLALPEDLLVDSIVQLSNKQCGCLIITSSSKELYGIFTDGDLRRAIQTHGTAALNMKLEDLMTKEPRCIGPDMLASQALEKMEENPKHPITVLIVKEGQKVVGLIKMHDILQSGI